MTHSLQQLARALFEVAQEENQLDAVASELENAQNLHQEIGNLLKNPNASQKEKISFLAQNGFSNITANFLLIIARNKQIHQIKVIINYFKDLVNEKSNSLEVKIITKSELENSEVEKIKQNLFNNLKKKIILETKTDPQILGGIKIMIGDNLVDNSLKNRLDQLKTELIR